MGDVAAAVLAAAAEQEKKYASIIVEKPLGKRLRRIFLDKRTLNAQVYMRG